MAILFRPHHFLCALCFQGKGYSSEFVDQFQTIMSSLNGPQGDDVMIHIVNYTDSICAPCPHRQGQFCASQNKIDRLDRSHAKALAIEHESTIRWGSAKKRIAENLSLDIFHQICAGCEWKDLGICEKVLRENLKSKASVTELKI